MKRELIYLTHDNTADLQLKADDVAVDLSTVSSMTVTIGGVTVTSDNSAGSAITWRKAGYATGEIRIALGSHSLTPGNAKAWLVVYDPDNPEGIVWGSFDVRILADVDA